MITSSVHALIELPGHPAVRGNTALPGPVLTRKWDRVTEDAPAASIAATAAKRFDRPEEVAAVVAFLAFEDASLMTGTFVVVVNVGWSIMKDSARAAGRSR